MKPIILQAKMKADDADKTLNQVKEKFNGIDEKLENNKISSITTLTIFSAVILAFSGGITFESGIFKGMVESSPYRLVFTIALSGFILFNTIFVLLYLVGKMAGKQISTKCKYLTNDSDNYSQCQSCGDGYCIKEYTEVSIACRFFHKYSYVFAVNIVLLYILYAVFFLWLSKGVLLDPRFYLSQGLLILFFGVFLAVYYVRKYIRLYKIKLHYRVSILEDIVESQMPISTLKGFHEVSPRPFYQAIPKSEKDSFLNKVQNMTRKKALKYFKEFVDEYRISNCRLLIHVTKQEHKINRKKWKELKKKFNSLIPSCRKNTILKHIGNFFKQH